MVWTLKANIKGPTGATGATGANGAPGVNAVANDTATASQANTPGSATYTALARRPRGDAFFGVACALKLAVDSFGIQATGDSTTTPDWAWFRLLANEVAAEYPTLTHHYRKWNDTTQDMDRPVAISTGAAGRRAMVMAAGATRVGVLYGGDNITGDIDLRVNLKNPTWASGATQALASKWTSDTSLSWVWYLTATGGLRFSWSTDGGFVFAGDKTSTVVVPFANDTEGWVRVVLDVDNGAAGNDVKFYTSTDGITWTQLGTTVTTAGITSIFASTSRYTVGARGSSSSPLAAATRIYEIQVRDGISGPSVVPYLPDMWENTLPSGLGVATMEGAPVVTWIMSGQPGGGLGYDAAIVGYLSDPVRMRKMSPNFNQLAMLYSTSHNDYQMHGNLWITKLAAWIAATSVDKLVAARILLTQNPRNLAGDTSGAAFKQRRGETMTWARRGTGFDAIDTYQAFIDDGRPLTDLINADGIHPVDAGYQLWKNKVKAELTAALARV